MQEKYQCEANVGHDHTVARSCLLTALLLDPLENTEGGRRKEGKSRKGGSSKIFSHAQTHNVGWEREGKKTRGKSSSAASLWPGFGFFPFKVATVFASTEISGTNRECPSSEWNSPVFRNIPFEKLQLAVEKRHRNTASETGLEEGGTGESEEGVWVFD